MNNRELDRILAERVMGWKLNGSEYEYRKRGLDLWNTSYLRGEVTKWEPAENIEQAFMVLNKMEKENIMYWSLQYWPNPPQSDSAYDCEIWVIPEEPSVAGLAPTPALAICRALYNAYVQQE